MSRATSFALAAVLTLPATLQAQAVPAGSMGHGISHPLAVWRAGTIQDVRYDLKLDLTPLDSAIGAVTIRFLRQGWGDAIIASRPIRILAGPIPPSCRRTTSRLLK